jgi:GAF domain-containing protein/PAS domain-containing protein
MAAILDRLQTNRFVLGFCAAFAAAGIATGIGLGLDLDRKPGAQVLFVVLAAAAAAVGGFWAGVLAGAVSFPLFIYFFLNRPRAFDVPTSRIVSLVVLAAGMVVVSYIVSRERRARELSAGAREVNDALARAGVAIWEWDPERDRLRWSSGVPESFGLPRSQRLDTRGRLLEAINADDRPQVQAAIEEALANGSDFEVEARTVLAAGGWRWVQLQGGVRRGLRGKRVSGLVRDVTTARRSSERERFLGGLTRALAVAPDYDEMLAELARLTVPGLGDWCWIDLVEDDGKVRNVVSEHSDPAKSELARELRRRYPVAAGDPRGAAAAIAEGKPQLYGEITDSLLLDATRGEEELDFYRRLGPRSAVVVPLRARGRTLGAVTLISSEGPRRYDEGDRDFLEEIAQLAGLMLDNARLHADEQAARQEAEAAAFRTERLQALTARLSASVSPPEVAQIIVDESRDVLGARAAWVSVRDGEELRLLAASGYRDEFAQKYRRIPLASDLAVAEVVRQGKARWIETVERVSGRYPELAEAGTAAGADAVAAVPLLGTEDTFASTARVRSRPRSGRWSPASSSSAVSRSSAHGCTRRSARPARRRKYTAASSSSSATSRRPSRGRSRSRSSWTRCSS